METDLNFEKFKELIERMFGIVKKSRSKSNSRKTIGGGTIGQSHTMDPLAQTEVS